MEDLSYVATPNFFLLLTNFLYVQDFQNPQGIHNVCLDCLTGVVLKALLSLVLTLFLHSGLFSESKKQTQVSFLLRRKGDSSQYSQWEVGLFALWFLWSCLDDTYRGGKQHLTTIFFSIVHPVSDWKLLCADYWLGDARPD